MVTLQAGIQGSEKTFMNLQASFTGPMQIFTVQQSLMRMLSTNQIDFREMGTRKTVLYIIMPDEKTTMHRLISLAIKQCYEVLIDTAQRCPGMKLPYRVNFLLDEFSNLPAIPDMSSMISAARSRNIRFYLVVQSMHQLISKYGDDAHTIRGNCNDWVYLTSRELSLLQELEELCGRDPQTRIPLISVSQLQRLDKNRGEALVLCGRLYPYLSRLADIDSYPFAHMESASLPVLPRVELARLNLDAVAARFKESINKGMHRELRKEDGCSWLTDIFDE